MTPAPPAKAVEMFTRTKYDVFKQIYDEEMGRCEELVGRSRLYLGICTFFAGGLAFGLIDEVMQADGLTVFVGFTTIGLFLITILVLVGSARVFPYKAMDTPDAIINETRKKYGKGAHVSDAEFLRDRMENIIVAYRENRISNDTRARYIQVATIGMVLGIIFAGLTVLMTALNTQEGVNNMAAPEENVGTSDGDASDGDASDSASPSSAGGFDSIQDGANAKTDVSPIVSTTLKKSFEPGVHDLKIGQKLKDALEASVSESRQEPSEE